MRGAALRHTVKTGANFHALDGVEAPSWRSDIGVKACRGGSPSSGTAVPCTRCGLHRVSPPARRVHNHSKRATSCAGQRRGCSAHAPRRTGFPVRPVTVMRKRSWAPYFRPATCGQYGTGRHGGRRSGVRTNCPLLRVGRAGHICANGRSRHGRDERSAGCRHSPCCAGPGAKSNRPMGVPVVRPSNTPERISHRVGFVAVA